MRRILPLHFCFVAALIPAVNGETIEFSVSDKNGKRLPCRIHIKDAQGTPQKAVGYPNWDDHFVCEGQAKVDLSPGRFTWEVERGPEYKRATGVVDLTVGTPSMVQVVSARISHLRSEGWYSGDLHVHRSINDIKLLMMAEDLDFAPVIEWWNAKRSSVDDLKEIDTTFDGHRIFTRLAGEDEREGGALLYIGLNRPLDITSKSREVPSPMKFVRAAGSRTWIDIEKPFWWDVPTWIASRKMHSIGIANNHMQRSGMLESEAWGRPRDTTRLPAPLGNGYWTQEIYYHILNTGFRISPSAGSASGVLKNPVGYNRVYVQLGDETFSRTAWFEALKAGRCFVTNGPLLTVTADGQHAGHVFQLSSDDSKSVTLEIKLSSVDKVSAVEIIQNGEIVQTIPCNNSASQQLSAKLKLTEAGWFLVRAIADVDYTFRFASTAPWYVESKRIKRRVSRASAEFFLTWLDERMERIQRDPKQAFDNRSDQTAVLRAHENARVSWHALTQLSRSNKGQQTVKEIEATSISINRKEKQSNNGSP